MEQRRKFTPEVIIEIANRSNSALRKGMPEAQSVWFGSDSEYDKCIIGIGFYSQKAMENSGDVISILHESVSPNSLLSGVEVRRYVIPLTCG